MRRTISDYHSILVNAISALEKSSAEAGLSLPELVSALPISGAAHDGEGLELPEFTGEVEGPDGQPADLF